MRVARGLTQAELAERSRSNVIFISRLERGVTTPTLGMLLRLSEALECRLYDLVEVFDRGPRVSPKSRKN
jgi:transcriptional regulator with XRE-family HTH domain